MMMYEPTQFIKTFVTDLDAALAKLKPNAQLTQLQRMWLAFCLMGILLTNSVCWAKFERASLGNYKIAALSWMFREAKVAWEYLLLASVTLVLERHGITEGVLVLDESDRARTKRTKRIYGVHKQKHKASGGYVNGQTVVLLLEDESLANKLKQLAGLIDDVFQLMPSGKQMSGRDLGCLEPTVSLKYRAAG